MSRRTRRSGPAFPRRVRSAASESHARLRGPARGGRNRFSSEATVLAAACLLTPSRRPSSDAVLPSGTNRLKRKTVKWAGFVVTALGQGAMELIDK
jgi:hypothetical protein